jgi:hypothetical protein
MGDVGDVVDLDILRVRLSSPLPLHDLCLVVRAQLAPALLTLAQAPDEGADTALGHQEGRGERVRAHLGQLIAVLDSADQSAAVAVDEHVAVFVRAREHAPPGRVGLVHDDRRPVLSITQEEARDVLGQRQLDEPDGLGLQDLGQVGERLVAQLQPRPLQLGQALALPDGIPPGAHGRRVVVDVVRAVLVDAQERLEVGVLAAELHAPCDGACPLAVVGELRVGPEQRRQRIAGGLIEGVRQQLTQVTPVDLREADEVEAVGRLRADLKLGSVSERIR